MTPQNYYEYANEMKNFEFGPSAQYSEQHFYKKPLILFNSRRRRSICSVILDAEGIFWIKIPMIS
jgi:hypothetical protein